MEVILDSGVVSFLCGRGGITSGAAIQCTYTIGAGDFDFDGQIEVPAGAVKFTRWRDVRDPTVTGTVANPLPAMKQVYKLPGLLIYGGSQAIDLSVTPQTVQEGTGEQALTIIAQNREVYTLTSDLVIPLSLTDISTDSGDYSVRGPLSVTIPAGKTEGRTTVQFTPTDDLRKEGAVETVRIEGSKGAMLTPFVRWTDLQILDAAGIRLTASPTSISEDGGAQMVTVTAEWASAGDSVLPQALDIALSWGGSAGTGDYGRSGGTTVTIPANGRSGSTTVTLTPTDDRLLEGDESIVIRGTTPGRTVTETEVTLTDDEILPAVSIAVDPETIQEGGGAQTVTVSATLDPDVAMASGATTLTLALEGTATGETDYTSSWSPTDRVITIPANATAGSNTVSLVLTPTDDQVAEGDETIVVKGTAVAGSRSLVVQVATVTLADDDERGINLLPSTVTVAEGGEGDYEVWLGTRPSDDVTITLSSRDSTIATISPSELVFKPGEWNTKKTVTVSGVEDAYNNVDDRRTTTIDHTAGGGGYGDVETKALSVNVTDNDESTSFSVADVSVAEGQVASLTVTRGGATGDAVSVKWKTAADTTEGNSPASSADYTEQTTAQTLSFAAGETTQMITIPTSQDMLDEEDETFVVELSEPSAGTSLSTTTATVTITDDDTAGVTITESGDGTTVSEDGTTTTDSYTVVLDSEPTHDVTVTVSAAAGVQVNQSEGTAGSSQTLTFTALNWAEVQTITVTGVDDDIDQGASHTVTISHTATSDDDDYDEITIDAVTVTVNDDDTAGVTVSESARTVAENGGTATYTVKLNTKPLSDVVITVTSGDGTAVKVDGPDDQATYSNTERLTFTAMNWAAEQTVMLQGQNDAVDTPGAGRTTSITHAVTTPDTGGRYTTTLTIDPVVVTVTDDDPTTVTLGRTGIGGIAENGGTVDFTVTLGRPLKAGETVTVPLSVSGAMMQHYTLGLKSGAGLNTGVTRNTANPHSAALPAVVFSGHASETVQTATLTLTAVNNADRDTRTVAIGYGTSTRVPTSNLSGGITPTGSVSVVLIDDDAMITVASASAAEGSAVRFTVTLPDPAPTGGVTIGYSTSNGRGNDADAAWQVAIAGTDYTAAPDNAMLTIPANGTGGTIEIATTDDSTYEGDHYFTVTLDSTTHFNLSATAGTAVGTITDVTDTPTFDWSASAVTVAEDDGTVTLTVNRSGASAVGSTVNWDTVNGTAVGGSDFTAVSSTALLFGTNDMAMVSVGVTDDSTDEVAESFEVALTAGAHAALGTVTRPAH